MESTGKETEDRELPYASGGSTVVRLLWETPPLFLINSCPSHVPAILRPVNYPREMKPYMHTKACMQMFTETFFIIAKHWKLPKCPSASEWMDQQVHSYTWVLLSTRERLNGWQQHQGGIRKTFYWMEVAGPGDYVCLVPFIWILGTTPVTKADQGSPGPRGWGRG